MEEAQVVPFHTPIHRRNRKDRQAYSLLLQTTMEPLPHGLWSCSSKPLTGRTGHQLKDASTTGTTGDTTASTGISPTTGQGLVSTTTCLVGTPSIEATTTPATGTTRHHLATNLAGDRLLRIAHPLTSTSLTPTSLTPTSVHDTPLS